MATPCLRRPPNLRDFETLAVRLLGDAFEMTSCRGGSSTISGINMRWPVSCPSRRRAKVLFEQHALVATCWSMIHNPSPFTATMKLELTCPSGLARSSFRRSPAARPPAFSPGLAKGCR